MNPKASSVLPNMHKFFLKTSEIIFIDGPVLADRPSSVTGQYDGCSNLRIPGVTLLYKLRQKLKNTITLKEQTIEINKTKTKIT